jgi:hypothetical protein
LIRCKSYLSPKAKLMTDLNQIFFLNLRLGD